MLLLRRTATRIVATVSPHSSLDDAYTLAFTFRVFV